MFTNKAFQFNAICQTIFIENNVLFVSAINDCELILLQVYKLDTPVHSVAT
jgi:hypothetical protein